MAAPVATVRRMNDALVHRGPDAEGVWSHGPCALGHRRLSIIDLSPEARQPLLNEDETVAVVRDPAAIAGPIVVFGNPLVQLASGRDQAGRIPGFLANTLGPDEWRKFAAQMRRTPPAYVYIGEVQGTSEDEYLRTRGREVSAILEAAYCPAREVPDGRWLVRCADVPATGGGG